MDFIVTYRLANGERTEEPYEAADRADVFRQLAAKGITAISVREGKLAKAKRAPSRRVAPSGSSSVKGLIAGLVVIIGAVVAFLAVFSRRDAEPVETEPSAPSVEQAETAVPTPEPPAVETEEEKAKRERREMLAKMSLEERRAFLQKEMIEKPLDLTPTTNRAFRTGTEQVMSWIFTTDLGSMPPPLPKISIRDEAHIMEILDAPNPIFEGDSDRAKDAKEMVALAKEELRKFLDEGGKVQDFLEYYRGQLMQAHQEWTASQKEVMKVIREEPDLAADFIEEVNKRLSEKGIKPVSVPPKFREELGL